LIPLSVQVSIEIRTETRLSVGRRPPQEPTAELLLARGCSITPDRPDVLLHAARQVRDASVSAA